MKPVVFCVVGRSNTGKTTLIEKLIPRFVGKGIKVATIKHHHLPFEMDLEGKDTYRHKHAGAVATMIVAEKSVGLVKDMVGEASVTDLVAQYLDDVDLVIVEGYKRAPLPKIEVYNYQEGIPPVAETDENLVAIVADRPLPASVPVFLRDDIDAIGAFISDRFGLG